MTRSTERWRDWRAGAPVVNQIAVQHNQTAYHQRTNPTRMRNKTGRHEIRTTRTSLHGKRDTALRGQHLLRRIKHGPRARRVANEAALVACDRKDCFQRRVTTDTIANLACASPARPTDSRCQWLRPPPPTRSRSTQSTQGQQTEDTMRGRLAAHH